MDTADCSRTEWFLIEVGHFMRNSFFLRMELEGTKRDSVASFWGPALL